MIRTLAAQKEWVALVRKQTTIPNKKGPANRPLP